MSVTDGAAHEGVLHTCSKKGASLQFQDADKHYLDQMSLKIKCIRFNSNRLKSLIKKIRTSYNKFDPIKLLSF